MPTLHLAGAWLLSLPATVEPAFAAATMPYAVRAWTIENGLPTSTVQDIAQTPDGYLWLSTTGGLARFDGVRFESFGLADGLPTNRFQGLAVDRTGALWISAEDGNLIRWDGRWFTHQPTGTLGAAHDGYWVRERDVSPLRPGVDSTTAAVVDAHGAVWLTLASGTPARLSGETVVPIGPAGRLGDRWIVDQRSGVARFVRSRGADAELLDTRLERVAWLPGAGLDNAQWIDREGRLWSLAGNGVAVRDANSGRLVGTLSLGLTTQRAGCSSTGRGTCGSGRGRRDCFVSRAAR